MGKEVGPARPTSQMKNPNPNPNPNRGWACSSHFTDEEGNDQCKAMISAKGGGCDSSAGYNGHANQADCEGDGKTWITFSAPSTAYYRLASTYSETWDEDTGNRKLVKLEGDKTKCEAEKVATHFVTPNTFIRARNLSKHTSPKSASSRDTLVYEHGSAFSRVNLL